MRRIAWNIEKKSSQHLSILYHRRLITKISVIHFSNDSTISYSRYSSPPARASSLHSKFNFSSQTKNMKIHNVHGLAWLLRPLHHSQRRTDDIFLSSCDYYMLYCALYMEMSLHECKRETKGLFMLFVNMGILRLVISSYHWCWWFRERLEFFFKP